MPDNIAIGFFVFGAVLILISLLGGGFKIFTVVISATISNPFIRIIAFVLGIASMLLALAPSISFALPEESTNTPSIIATGNFEPS